MLCDIITMEKLLFLQSNSILRLAVRKALRNGNLIRSYVTCLGVTQGISSKYSGTVFDRNHSLEFSKNEHPSSSFLLPNIGNNVFQCCTKKHLHSWLTQRNKPLTFHEFKCLKLELKAARLFFNRSFPDSHGILDQLLHIKPSGSARYFSTENSKRQRQHDSNDQDDDKDKDEDEQMPFLARIMLMFWVGFLVYIIVNLQSSDREDAATFQHVSWNEFVHDMMSKGEVKEILVRPDAEIVFVRLHPGAIIKGRKIENLTYTLRIPDPDRIEDRIRRIESDLGVKPGQGVPITYQRGSSWAVLIPTAIAAAVIFMFFRFMAKQVQVQSWDMFAGVRKAKFTRADLIQGKGISFKDVAGLQEAKQEVMEFVDYLKRPEKFKELGGRIPCGALLLGPPGCGKTLLAKAVATEAKVPFLAMAGSEFVEMVGGLGAARVRSLFQEARKKAPCIIYIDEIDAIGRRRSGDNWSHNVEEEHTLNQLLVEMDGMGTTEGVIMLASTNRHEVLDKALLRPGRFDRHIMIDLPTLIERKEIFEMYLSNLTLRGVPKDYSDKLSQMSPGMSGADIANICNEAALHAARDKKKAVDHHDFDYAVERVVAGIAKKSRVLSPKEKRIVAYHEAGHALAGWLLKHTDPMLRVSIVPRTNAALGFAQYLPSDKKLISADELFDRMCMALGGRVAESITFNSVTSGAQDDLRKVTKIAYEQVRNWGMNDTVGQVSFPDTGEGFGTKPYSKKLAHTIDQESQRLVATAYKETEKMLNQNKEKLRVIAEALLEKECLTYTDMEQLVGPPPHGKKGNINLDWDKPSTPSEPAAA